MSIGVKARRGILLGAAVAALAVPASAGAFATHFSVISHTVRGHQTENGFSFRDALLNPANPANRVGYDHGKCRFAPGDNKPHCKAIVHLDGTIGGFGDLFVKGNFGHGDHTLNVLDGDGDFSGAITGKMVIDSLSRRDDLLTFTLTR